MTIYLAGPMSGVEAMNYPAFHAAAARLRAAGYHVENPADNHPNPEGVTWEEGMKAAIPQMLRCDAVVLLPGWLQSRGARIETYLARTLGIPVHPMEWIGDAEALR